MSNEVTSKATTNIAKLLLLAKNPFAWLSEDKKVSPSVWLPNKKKTFPVTHATKMMHNMHNDALDIPHIIKKFI